MAPRIVSGAKAHAKLPITAGDPPDQQKISFSFQHWRQTDYFGLDRTQMDWIVGLLDRLRIVSEMTRDQWERSAPGTTAWRYHRVDWNAKAIPIRKIDLDWVPRQFLDNDDDHPIYQISLGAGQGRIAGFWETKARFAIVLFDPHHNLQPAGDYGYRVTECAEQPSPAALVHLAVDRVRSNLACQHDDCPVHRQLATIAVRKEVTGAYHYREVISIGLEEKHKKDAEELLAARRIVSVADIVTKGIETLTVEWLEEDDKKVAPDGG